MLEDGVFEALKPDAIFALHTTPRLRTGHFMTREGPIMASEDNVILTVRGRGTHASRPWDGIDPIAVLAQIVNAVQNIVSRQVNLAAAPAVITFGLIRGGTHANVIWRRSPSRRAPFARSTRKCAPISRSG